jgi:methionyl aminopeptidase
LPKGHGFSVVREFCGHGIGKVFHEEPQVLHYGRPGTLEELKPGMVFTIEPMINAGRREIKEFGNDGWTIVTKDRSLSAQWEHTVLVTPTGYEVMTLSAGSPPLPSFVHATSHLNLRTRSACARFLHVAGHGPGPAP